MMTDRIWILGAPDPEMEIIESILRAWAPAQGLSDIYGDPARGFAGGYLAT